MKIVQSFWTKPYLKNSSDGRFNGGWPDERAHAISWAYSFLRLNELYQDIELVTDKLGYEFLIERLELPYSSIKTDLDTLNMHCPSNWSLGKLKAYSLQNEPFIHVDSDVYIWQNFFNYFKNSDVVMQSRLCFNQFSSFNIVKTFVDNHMSVLPISISQYWEKNELFYAANAGVCGGANLQFFKELFIEAVKFITLRESENSNLTTQWYNMLFEEHQIFCKAHQENIKIDYLVPNISEDFREVCQIHNAPVRSKYIHLAGDVKRNEDVCYQVELRLKSDFPDIYKRINLIYSSSNKRVKYNRRINSKSHSADGIESANKKNLDAFCDSVELELTNGLIHTYSNSYTFLKNSNQEAIRDAQFVFNEKLIYSDCDSMETLIYYNHVIRGLDEIKLENLEQCLALFANPISINGICQLLISKKIVNVNGQNIESLKLALEDLVIWHFINTHILTLQKSQKTEVLQNLRQSA